MKVNFLLVGALALLMGCQGKSKTNEYVVIAGKSVVEDSLWNKVAQALVQKHEAAFLSYNQAPEEVLPQLQEIRPRYVAIVEKPEYLGRDYVIALNQMSRKVDNDMYAFFSWAIDRWLSCHIFTAFLPIIPFCGHQSKQSGQTISRCLIP